MKQRTLAWLRSIRRTLRRLLPQRSWPWAFRRRPSRALLLLTASLMLGCFSLGLVPVSFPFAMGTTVSRLQLAQAMQETLLAAGISAPPGQGSATDAVSGFADLSPDHWETGGLPVQHGLLAGFPDGTFRPSSELHQDELLHYWARLVRYLESLRHPGRRLPGRNDAPSAGLPEFPRNPADFLKQRRLPAPEGRLAGKTDEQSLRELAEATRRWWIELPTPPVPVAPPPKKTTEAGPEEVSPSPAGFVLRGRIVDSITRSAIHPAYVMLDDEVMPVDESGSFEIQGLPRDRLVEIFAVADGYQSLLLRHKVGRQKQLDLRLNRQAGSLDLRVVSAVDELPLVGARVSDGENLYAPGSDGQILLKGLAPGYVQLAVTAPGHLEQKRLLLVTEGRSSVTLKLDASAATGTVTE